LGVLFVLMSLASPLSAQEIATSFDQLRRVLKPGDTIVVTDAKGAQTTGRLGQLSTSSLEILVRKTAPDGRNVFVPRALLSESDVREIAVERRDSLLNGTLIGLAAGGWPWLFCLSDCTYGEPGGENFIRVIFATTTVIGTGVGAWIDYATRAHVPVFIAPGRRSSGLRVSPLLSPASAGVQLSVGF
jgi:hypothetical protein